MTAAKTSFLNWFAGRMAVAGLRHAFGVPGGGTSLDLLHALRENDIQSVITAREDAAVIMAGVSGLLAEAPGLAFSTRGPGLASAANGLASAALDRLPALLVSEAFGEDELEFLSHQVLSQSDLIKPLLEKGEGVELPADQGAVEAWLNGPKNTPAVMFPTSSQFKHQVLADKPEINNPHLPNTNMTDAKKLLQQAQRPVLVVGLEAARASTTSALRTFVEALGAPVLCTYMAKGCVPDDDAHFAGVFTGGSIEQACLNEADLIILIGLDPVEVISKPWAYTAPVLDLCERVYDPHYLKPTARIVAPLSVSLSAFADCLQETTYKTTYSITWQKSEITKLKSDFDQSMEGGGSAELSSAAVVKSIRDCFPARPRLCVDAGAHMFSACAFWPARAPHDLLISNGLATMGFAVPAAIAAALHDPGRGAIAVTGDGGLMMCLGELKTVAQTAANITIIVFNDGRLSLIDIKREDRQMPDLGLSWTPPDFAAIASGFGFQSWKVNSATELTSALTDAANAKGPRLVDVRVDASGYRDQMRALRG